MRTGSKRRGPLIFIFLICLVVGILLHRSRLLLELLFKDGAPDSIPVGVTYPPYDEISNTSFIPKIIHQTYIDENIPSHWQKSQQATKDLHPEWEYMFWTDDSASSFILTHYPQFYPTYTSYRYPIQRADAIRYFILYHYGGIYLDLDLKPHRELTPLIQYPAFACRTEPTGISNDIMGSRPGHPFYKLVIDNLKQYDKNWFLPYVTVMYTTGPLFLSAIWVQYLKTALSHDDANRFRLLFPDNTRSGDTYGFIHNVQGGSWHQQDVAVIFWMGKHWILVTIFGFVIGFGVTGLFWVVMKKFAKALGGKRSFGRGRKDGLLGL